MENGRNLKISRRSGTPRWNSSNELSSWAAVGESWKVLAPVSIFHLSKGGDFASPLQSILGPMARHAVFWEFGSFAVCPTTPTHLPLSVPKLSLLQRSHRNVDPCQATSWTFHSSPWLGGSKEAKLAGCLTIWGPNSPWKEWSSLLAFSNKS